MTSASQATAPEKEQDAAVIKSKFNDKVGKARFALFLERAVPRSIPPLCTSALFVSSSWFGLWHILPPGGRTLGVLLFAAAAVASPLLVKTKSLFVTRDEAIDRLDSLSGNKRKFARELDDGIAASGRPEDQALLDLHIESAWKAGGSALDPGKAKIEIQSKWKQAAAALSVALAAGGFMAGGEWDSRIAKAFDWTTPPVPVEPAKPIPPLEVRARITPPDAIDFPAFNLTENNKDKTDDGKALVVHRESLMTLTVHSATAKVRVNGSEIAPKRVESFSAAAQGKPVTHFEIKFSKDSDTEVAIEGGPVWTFKVRQDKAPTAAIKAAGTGEKDKKSLDIEYRTADDYGVKGGQMSVRGTKQDPAAQPLPSSKLPQIELP